MSIVVDHIEHVIKIAGPGHVGLSADWDGVNQVPAGLEDCSKVIYITEEMLARGNDAATINRVLGVTCCGLCKKSKKPPRRCAYAASVSSQEG